MELSDADAVPTRSVTTSNNERLPYDILGLIFHRYSLRTPSHPDFGVIKLETLLLVCRAWYFAALGHGTLWSHLEVRIYNTQQLLYWKIHAPLRLSRSSPTALLDVVLETGPFSREPLPPSETEMLRSIVLDLVGPEGCVAKRWQTVWLGYLPDAVLPLFCVPTPNLVDLALYYIALQHQCLPEAPVLETFHSHYSQWRYPDLRNLANLIVRGDCPEEIDAEAISKAQRLINLTVMYDNFNYQLRGDFPVLEYLHLEDVLREDSFTGFSAPRLKILSLHHYSRQSYLYMLKCLRIRFHALEELVLRLDSHLFGSNNESTHHEGVRLVLQAAVNINLLRITSKESMATMLDILGDLSICQNHHFVLEYLDYSMALRQGEARGASIAAIRLEADL